MSALGVQVHNLNIFSSLANLHICTLANW